jgi:hypothetical protein
MAPRPSRHLTSLLLACLALGAGAHAAELGDARVSSHIGQQLVADIELTALDNPGTPVQVRLAHPDVYRGANVAMAPALSTLSMSVMQRDGRQFLHVTSLKPVDADHLHLYLELVDGGHRAVRLSTLWLSPDPNPAPPPPPPAPEREVPATPLARPAPVEHAAQAVHAVPPVRVAPAPPPVRVAQPVRVRLPLPAAPVHLPVVPKAAPAACTPRPSEEAGACIALDAKNVALRAQIDRLEQKVKVLQGSMQGGAPAVAQPAKAAEAPAGPRPIKPRKTAKHPEPQHAGLPWLAIGLGAALLLALAGGGAWFVRRRRAQAAMPKPSPAVSREGIKSRLMGGP